MLKLYNTMTRSIEEFSPINKNTVKIFTCGPSIYQKAHLGNFRTFLYEDILVKYLNYSGYTVKRAMNLTDIEDKTIKEATKKNTDVKTLTNSVLKNFKEGLKGLNITIADYLTPATETVEQAVKIIKQLTKENIAYEYKGDYYFDPLKINNFGKLYRLDMSKWPTKKIRYKKDTYNGNRWNRGDFILWHSYENESNHPFWNTEIGKGRPSWNIQDPSVVTMTLGQQIDINCGGIDNIYRHHDYNIAVMEAYTKKEYSKFYLHGEHLMVNGKSMSKSAGNIIYPEDLIAKGYQWSDIRFFLIYSHYRKKLNYTQANFDKTINKLKTLRTTIKTISHDNKTSNPEAQNIIDTLQNDFNQEMETDLSLGKAFDKIEKNINKIYSISKKTPISKQQYHKLNCTLIEIDKVLKVIYNSTETI